MRIVASLVASVSALIAGCMVDALPLEGKACPCIGGFVCDEARNVCVREAAADSGADSAPLPDDDAGTRPPQNLHDHGTFDTGCSAWISYESEAISSEVARSGARSCQFCAEGTTTGFAADDRGFLLDPPLGTYRAEAWVRVPPGKPASNVHMYVRSSTDTEEVERETSEFLVLDETWRLLSVRFAMTKPARSINVVVWADAAPDVCFLLDDVAVYRDP